MESWLLSIESDVVVMKVGHTERERRERSGETRKY